MNALPSRLSTLRQFWWSRLCGWLRPARGAGPRVRPSRPGIRPGVELLEDRALMSASLPDWAYDNLPDGVELGIHDKNAAAFLNPDSKHPQYNQAWDALGVQKLRTIAPYDVALETADPGSKRKFDHWY